MRYLLAATILATGLLAAIGPTAALAQRPDDHGQRDDHDRRPPPPPPHYHHHHHHRPPPPRHDDHPRPY